MISNVGKIVMIILVLGIAFAALTAPKKPSSPLKSVPSVAEIQATRGVADTPEEALAQLAGEAAPAPAKPPAPAPANPVFSAPSAAMIPEDLELLQERFGRADPFAPLFDIPVESNVVDFELPDLFPLPAPAPRPLPSFKLTAVALGDGANMAVINGHILGVGDYVEGFAVSAIRMDGVELVGEFGDRIMLRIQQDIKGSFDIGPGSISNVEGN